MKLRPLHIHVMLYILEKLATSVYMPLWQVLLETFLLAVLTTVETLLTTILFSKACFFFVYKDCHF